MEKQSRQINPLLLSVTMILLHAFLMGCSPGDSKQKQNHLPPGNAGLSITRGPADLAIPPTQPHGECWRYGIGFPFQVAPARAAILCNIRRNLVPYGDFEVGTDVILLDDVNRLDKAKIIPLSRGKIEPHPITGQSCYSVKFTACGGFVPRGAKRPDGFPHPHAGTGFGIEQFCFYPADFSKPFPSPDDLAHRIERYEFYYDGDSFQSQFLSRESNWHIPEGWQVTGPGLSMAIPDGDDLLFPLFCAGSDQSLRSGVARFARQNNRWQPISFTPVTDPGSSWNEPTLIRDKDGALLFCAQGGRRGAVSDLPVWRSGDGGKQWQPLFHLKGATTGTALALNRTADGIPFIATTLHLGTDRNMLDIAALNESRTGLLLAVIARDRYVDLGPPPSGQAWKIDHGVGAPLRLADRRWHSILVYRVMDQAENTGAPPTPHTGCYVEELSSQGKPIPLWNF